MFCTLKGSDYICNADSKLYIHEAQIVDNTLKEYVILGYGKFEQGGKTTTYTHGAVITTIPDSITPADESGIVILNYKKDDVFCKGTHTVRDSTFVELYGNIAIQGKLVTNIPYKYHRVIRDNVLAKNFKIKVPLLFFDLNTAYLLRSKSNPMIEYRMVQSGEYVTMNAREVVSQSGGTFGAATFEDPSSMIFINLKRKKSEEATSALEKYMLM